MKRFKFRLERVLQIFNKRRDQQKMAVHQAQKNHDMKQEFITDFKYHIVEQENRFYNLMRSGQATAVDCVSWENYIDSEYGMLERYKKELMELQRILDEEKRKYLAIDKECKTLEKLKDKKKGEFYFEQNLTVQKEMDEIATQRTIKKLKTEGGF
ncbi:MAG TPA: flagellar export protein FliJ [Thermotogota bacterium]|nr:flagellar export protein FliJ [Thermotogota bacterium]HPJ87924.1 flagellar export protein FliJ [Thermotogota bacterium]HPR95017.1 flagellar export protein FliJ [Thermotogota bacterium]